MKEFKLYDDENTLLMIPGPVPIHPRVLRALSKPIYGHRTNEFRALLADIEKMLKPLFGTTGTVIMITGSGTAGMDAALRSFAKPGDKIISFVAGKFGERFYDIAKRISPNTVRVDIEWGKAIKPSIVEDALRKHRDAKIVTLTHNETSTGVLHPLPEISKIVKDYGALLIVDGITSVGGDYVKMDEWKVDVMVAGSQKCIGIPPGLAFVALRHEVEEYLESSTVSSSYYTDLRQYLDYWKNKNDLPFTGAVSLFYALYESLSLIHSEGIEKRILRHRRLAKITRRGIKSLGLEIFAEEGYESNTVTAVRYPDNISDADFRRTVRKYGVLIAGGQAHLKGKIFRIAHMNIIGEREILTALSVIELALRKLGFQVRSSGVQGAIDSILQFDI